MMSMIAWSELVTRLVREHLPDVRAVRTAETVTWTYGDHVAMLTTSKRDSTWWLKISSTSSAAGPLTFTDRHDPVTARVAASNILVHFDSRFCRGIDVAPYPAEQLVN